MVKTKATFQLDISAAGREILQDMVRGTIERSGNAIASRAISMASSISRDNVPNIKTTTKVGTIKRGKRSITTISADYNNKREEYVARTALAKAKDAGRIN